MAFDVKKFLDQAGVGHLWEKVADKVESSVAAEKQRAEQAEAGLQSTLNTQATKLGVVEAGVAQAQSEVDALETLVGVIPEGYDAKTIAEYAKELADNVAANGYDDTALANRVSVVEGKVTTIEADYLKAADKTELSEAIEGVDGRVATIEGDYLKASDKKALQDAIDVNAAAIEVLTNGVDAEKVDGVKDLIDYVDIHGAEVTGMKEDIQANVTAIEGLGERIDDLEAINHDLYATKEALGAETQAREAAVSGLDTRLQAVESFDHSVYAVKTQVATDIATAKGEAIEAAAADAQTKADAARDAAKSYADSLAVNYATAAQGEKADSALQAADIVEGSANGTIAVKGTNVKVHGLGTAAYTNADEYEVAGAAQEVYASIQALSTAEIDNIINGTV